MRRDELKLPDAPPNDRPGDHWMCGRSSDAAPCSQGPGVSGICPLADACQPKRTWHGQRTRVVMTLLAFTFVATLVSFHRHFAPGIYKPGELSTPHAQILSGTLTSSRCASCHPNANDGNLFQPGTPGHEGISQTDRCLECHHTTIGRANARRAHSLPPEARARLRVAMASQLGSASWHDLLPGPAVDQEKVECSTCHKEHRGAAANLLAVSDAQCQTCHQDRFGSFASAHPDWQQWPYGRGGEISFNHASHANVHYPAKSASIGVHEFRCQDCHAKTADNELVRSTSYEVACQSCHEDTLRLESAGGIDLLALPSLPPATANQLDSWPDQATSFFDGEIAPLTQWLLRHDPGIADAIRKIPQQDFRRIQPDDSQAVAAGVLVADAHRQLLRQIAEQGQSILQQRAQTAGVNPATIDALARSLSPQLIADTHRRWFASGSTASQRQAWWQLFPSPIRLVDFQDLTFPPSPSDSSSDDDLLLGDEVSVGNALLGNELLLQDNPTENDGLLDDDLLEFDPAGGSPTLDPLSVPPLSSGEIAPSPGRSPERFDAAKMLSRGGWYRDDLVMAIRYRGGGHADPVLKSTIELISQLPAADPVRKRLLQTQAVAACIRCHSSAAETTGSWRSASKMDQPGDFTKFAHGPHLNVSQLADCRHCHTIESTVEAVGTVGDGLGKVHEFSPLGRQSCAGCHTARGAGDGCVKCHRYHIDPHPRAAVTRRPSIPVQSR